MNLCGNRSEVAEWLP